MNEVNTILPAGNGTTVIKKEETKEEKQARTTECTQMIIEVFKKYNCEPIVYITVGSDGSTQGNYKIVAK